MRKLIFLQASPSDYNPIWIIVILAIALFIYILFLGIKDKSIQFSKINKKRILIVWCLFHSFALAVNLIPIRGEFDIKGSDGFNYPEYIFTSERYNQDGLFWPFTKIYKDNDYSGYMALFKGIFYNYTVSAFVAYITLGFIVMFLPKLWSNVNE